jgi:uncharacterized protein YqgC (DUF456 family)
MEMVWFGVALLLMVVGTAGTMLPFVPGTLLVLGAAVGHRVIMGSEGAPWWVLGVMALMTTIALVADHVASLVGAQKLGATRRGMVGAVVGGIVGLFFGPVGILSGPFLGAFAFEWSGGREWRESARAGVGATLGILFGALGKLACAVGMTLLFASTILWRAYGG